MVFEGNGQSMCGGAGQSSARDELRERGRPSFQGAEHGRSFVEDTYATGAFHVLSVTVPRPETQARHILNV